MGNSLIALKTFPLIALLAVVSLAIACAGATETIIQTVVVEKEVAGDTVVQTVIVERDVKGDTVVQTVVVEKQVLVVATATPGPAAAPSAPGIGQGTLNLAVRSMGPGSWVMKNNHPSELSVQLSISEGFFMPDPANSSEDVGMLVESWNLASDLSSVTLTLHKGVQFHDGWGEMKAADAVFSVNQANAGVTPNNIHGQSGDLAAMFNEWTVVDDYTINAPFNNYDSTWQRGLLNVWFESVDVLSKKVFDDLGEDKANETRVATGPFRAVEWREHDRIIGEAVADHWRAPPKIERFIVREMPEESSRIAALKTGEIDIAEIRVLRNLPDLLENGIILRTETDELQQPTILFAGNLWETVKYGTNEPLDRPGFDPSLPWVGDPDDAVSMENARNVRWAMALAIDRESIREAILGDLGAVNDLAWFSSLNAELWEDRWAMPYDVPRAKQLLKDAGYEDGFPVTVELYDSQIYGPSDVSKFVASQWRDNLGLEVSVSLAAYASFRPSIVTREASHPWVSGCNYGRNLPADWPRGSLSSSLSRGGFSCGFESAEFAKAFLATGLEPDRVKRVQINKDLGDYMNHWQLAIGTIEVPGIWAQNPDNIASWDLRRGFKNTLNSLETVELK